MLVCSHCRMLVDHLDTEKEWHLECDRPTFEEIEINVCPHCGAKDTVVKASKCPICGEHYYNEKEIDEPCDDCIEKYETVGEALAIGAENTEEVKGINGFAASVLSVEQINKILIKWVEENFVDHSKAVKEYCEDDESYFAEWITEKYGD